MVRPGWTFGLFLSALSAATGLLTTDWVSGTSVTTAFKVNGVPRSLGVKSKLFCGWCSSGNEAGNLKQRTWSWMWKILNEQSKPLFETGTRKSRFLFKITNYEYSTWVPTTKRCELNLNWTSLNLYSSGRLSEELNLLESGDNVQNTMVGCLEELGPKFD